jgi:hypothetical protein
MKGLRELADLCKQQILDRQLPGGGWGFGKTIQWATEPTCLALLALRLEPRRVYARGLTFLLRCQSSNGSWPAFADDDQEGSWVTALVVITLIRLTADWKAVERGVSWLLSTRGQESHWLMKWRHRTIDQKVRFDPDKYGWPWTVGTTSWVVPTAYGLMALRRRFTCCIPDAVDVRLRKGVEMLFDRACLGGGWNAGNGVVNGIPLTPHADVTSLALLALIPMRDHPFVKKSLDWLQRQIESTPSLYSLSWMAIAVAAHREVISSTLEKINRLYSDRGLSQDCQTLALTRLAVQMVLSGASPF